MFFLSNYNACSPVIYFDVPPPPPFPLEISNPFYGEGMEYFLHKVTDNALFYTP